MIWKDFSKAFRDGDHAFLSASNHAWFNYDADKLVRVYMSKLAAAKGTALHDLAKKLITMKVRLPDNNTTLSMYVNQCIDMKLRPEYKLFYSKFAYGTADCIGYDDGVLRISDLKTGTTRVSFLQLEIYAALFFLCYPEIPLRQTKSVELRIYQNQEVALKELTPEEILPVMDKIKNYTIILQELEVSYDEGFDSLWSSP